jgi:hypothetical protein
MGRREPRDDCWFRVVASVSQLERQTTGMDEQRASRLALAPRLLVRKAIMPAPTGRVTARATKRSCPERVL